MRVRITPQKRKPQRNGFTLIELLVVISIIAVLASLVLPGVQQARATARKTQCLNNMRNVGIAMQTYATDHRGDLPPLAGKDVISTTAIPASWAVHILPNVEQGGLYNRLLDLSLLASGETLASLRSTKIEVYTCPDDPNDAANGAMSYVVNGGYVAADVWASATANPRVDGFIWQASGGTLSTDPINVNVSAGTGMFFYESSGAIVRSPEGFSSSIDKVIAGDGLTQTIMLTENLDTNNFASGAGGFSSSSFGDLAFAVPALGTTASSISTIELASTAGGYGVVATPASARFALQPASTVFPAGVDGSINSQLGIVTSGQSPRPSSLHSGAVNVIFGDGSGRNIAENIDQTVYIRLVSSNGNRFGQQILSNSDY